MTPAVRFKGFADPWEQRKLNEYLAVSAEKNLDGDYGREDVLSVSRDYGVVNQIEFQGRSYAGASVLNYGVLPHGGIVYTKSPLSSNPFGIIKSNKGSSGIVSTLYAVYSARENTEPDFVDCYFQQDDRLNRYLHPLVNKGAKNDMKVSAENALLGLVCFPARQEQRMIAELFQRLDTLITLHQGKYDQLGVLKKALLDKMFPRDGTLVPELRFAGFADPWEQRKLGEFGSVEMCKRIYKEQTSESGEVPFFKIGTFGSEPDAFISNKLYESYRDEYPYPEPGTPLISAAGSIGRTVVYQGERAYYQDSNIVWLDHDDNLDNSFLDVFYSQVDWKLEGSTIKRLYNKDILNAEVCVPSLPEQRAVGTLFSRLDSLIALHQRKLELLKNLKAALLEKMFV